MLLIKAQGKLEVYPLSKMATIKNANYFLIKFKKPPFFYQIFVGVSSFDCSFIKDLLHEVSVGRGYHLNILSTLQNVLFRYKDYVARDTKKYCFS